MTYTLVFSSVNPNALIIDILLKGSYEEIPCIFVVEDNMFQMYFPDSLFTVLGEEGYKNCFDDKFLSGYKKQAEEEIMQCKRLISQKQEVATLDKEQFSGFFDSFIRAATRFFRVYRMTEFFHFGKLEAELISWAKTNFPEKYADIVAGLLGGKDLPGLPVEISRIVGFTREIQHLRLKMREVLNEVFFGDSVFAALDKKFGEITGRKDFAMLNIDEIRNVLAGADVSPAGERIKLLAVFKEGNKWNFVGGAKAKEIAEKVKPSVEGISELKGIVASPGNARGTACVYPFGIMHKFENMQKGDILIASTTGPEFMAALQKAGAIVTDEGGLMSHAAVVSRELKIPCIVGTKIATKVLKDGDLVEVDAEKGIVRRIK